MPWIPLSAPLFGDIVETTRWYQPRCSDPIRPTPLPAIPLEIVNRNQLAKAVGYSVRLQPAAKGPLGEAVDDDWLIIAVGDDMITLEHQLSQRRAHIGLDGVYSYLTDAHGRRTADEKRGFLQLFMQVAFCSDGTVTVTPLFPPRIPGVELSPIDAQTSRLARPDSGQRMRLGAAQRVFAVAMPHDLALEPARQIHVASKDITRVEAALAIIAVALVPTRLLSVVSVSIVVAGVRVTRVEIHRAALRQFSNFLSR